jgi:hypothetical protein
VVEPKRKASPNSRLWKEIKLKVRVKSKLSMLFWFFKNGIIVPTKYRFVRIGKHKEGQHNSFSYGKFARSGSVGNAYPSSCDNYFEVNGYEYHKDLLKEIK